MNKYSVKKGETLNSIATKFGIDLDKILKLNKISDPNKIREGNILVLPDQEQKRVDFVAYMADKINGGNRNRVMNIPAMEQFQDSIISRNFDEPLRLALLASAAQEMDLRGAASIGIGGNGYLGFSKSRMPVELLDDTPEGRAKQIHYILEDLTHVYNGHHPQAGNWSNGGDGGPVLLNGKDAYDKFWKASDPTQATLILNKGYIRPKERLNTWNNRAEVAEGMKLYLKKSDGVLNYFNYAQ